MTAANLVFVLYTGGTFGGIKTPDGVAPAPLDRLATLLPSTSVDVTIEGFGKILDSSSVLPADWVAMAQIIAKRYDHYDGFVILHGTDTMAYTSSALTWLLPGLDKPVVLTGSQVPLSFPNNDAAQNYQDAVEFACGDNPGVWLVFGGRQILGNRAVKVSCENWQAFDDPKSSDANANSGAHFRTNGAKGPFYALDKITPDVRLIYCHPGMSVEQLVGEILIPAKGLVIASYGVGNLPDDPRIELALIKAVHQQGKRIVQVTQCAHGAVDAGFYSAGGALVRSGVEAGGDMTIEAALTRLMVELA